MSTAATRRDALVRLALDRHGQTYAQEAGIRLTDKPAPLFQLLTVSLLLSARISATVAVDAAKELFGAGYRTARAMREASWQARVDALGRGHYRRYDESTSTMLEQTAKRIDLPVSARGLSTITTSPRQTAELAAALVRLSRDSRAAKTILRAAKSA
jgi:hypothetical protein